MAKWTSFFDMCSGGSRKTEYDVILIEAGENLARMYFRELTGRDPDFVTCTCCGSDFSIHETDGDSFYHKKTDYKTLIISREDESFKEYINKLIG